MTDTTTPNAPWKLRLFWKSLLSAFLCAVGYLLFELIAQHDLTWAALGMLGLTVLLTPIIYGLNLPSGRTSRR